MNRIYLNLKRFDIPTEAGGVNSLAAPEDWARSIIEGVREGLKAYDPENVVFGMYFPELHLYPALQAAGDDFPALIGPQSVYREDVEKGGNFGAFTSLRTAKSVKALGADSCMIGHCEERKDKYETMLAAVKALNPDLEITKEEQLKLQEAVNRQLNAEVLAAQAQGLEVLYCLGEKAEESDFREDVLKIQIEVGLKDVDPDHVTIAYEPVWAIGPGKTPPGAEAIAEVARYLKKVSHDLPVVYGGGLKKDNAAMLASVPEIDGGLIALTSFTDPVGFYPDQYLEIIDIFLKEREDSEK